MKAPVIALNAARESRPAGRINLQENPSTTAVTRQTRLLRAARNLQQIRSLGVFHGRLEDLSVEQLVPKPGIEALDVAILPRAARSDVGGLGSDRRVPLLDGLGDELRAVVGADVARHAAQDEQVREHVDDVDGLE